MLRTARRNQALLAALAVLPACVADDDDDSTPPATDLEELCNNFKTRSYGAGCGEPECVDYPPCQIPTVRISEDWPRFGFPEGSFPWLLAAGGPAGTYLVSADLTLGEPDWEFRAWSIPSPPWEPGLTIRAGESVLFEFPAWRASGSWYDWYVFRHSFGTIQGEPVDGVGGWLDIDYAGWETDDGYTQLLWRGSDLTPGDATAPWKFSRPRGAGTSRFVGDIDGRGERDYAISVGWDLWVYAGEDAPPDDGGEPLVRIMNSTAGYPGFLFDPQDVGDITGDGVDDLVVAATRRLDGSRNDGDGDSCHALLFVGRAIWPVDVADGSADGRFEAAEPLAISAAGGREYYNSPLRVAAGDVDGDGLRDLVLSARDDPPAVPGYDFALIEGGNSAARVYLNPGTWPPLSTTESAVELRFPGRTGTTWGGTRGLAVADLDSDGDADVFLPLGVGSYANVDGLEVNYVGSAIWWGDDVRSAPAGTEIWPSGQLAGRLCEEREGVEGCANSEVTWEAQIVGDSLVVSMGFAGLEPGWEDMLAGIQTIPLVDLASAFGR